MSSPPAPCSLTAGDVVRWHQRTLRAVPWFLRDRHLQFRRRDRDLMLLHREFHAITSRMQHLVRDPFLPALCPLRLSPSRGALLNSVSPAGESLPQVSQCVLHCPRSNGGEFWTCRDWDASSLFVDVFEGVDREN